MKDRLDRVFISLGRFGMALVKLSIVWQAQRIRNEVQKKRVTIAMETPEWTSTHDGEDITYN
jgi:hypothetical protein